MTKHLITMIILNVTLIHCSSAHKSTTPSTKSAPIAKSSAAKIPKNFAVSINYLKLSSGKEQPDARCYDVKGDSAIPKLDDASCSKTVMCSGVVYKSDDKSINEKIIPVLTAAHCIPPPSFVKFFFISTSTDSKDILGAFAAAKNPDYKDKSAATTQLAELITDHKGDMALLAIRNQPSKLKVDALPIATFQELKDDLSQNERSQLDRHLSPMIDMLLQQKLITTKEWPTPPEIYPLLKRLDVYRNVSFGAENGWIRENKMDWSKVGDKKDFLSSVVMYDQSAEIIGMVATAPGVGSCFFDSGGAIVTNKTYPKIIGTESFGTKPCIGGLTYKVLTAPYKSWIEQQLSELSRDKLSLTDEWPSADQETWDSWYHRSIHRFN